MLGNYGSNLETRTCGVVAIRRPRKDEASSLLPIFQTKLAILRQRDIVFFFLHQPQVVSWNLHSYFSPDGNEWDNRFQQIQQPIIAEQRLSQFFSNFTDYCPLYKGSISAKLTLRDREKVSTVRRCPLYRGVHYAEFHFQQKSFRRTSKCPL